MHYVHYKFNYVYKIDIPIQFICLEIFLKIIFVRKLIYENNLIVIGKEQIQSNLAVCLQPNNKHV